MPVRTGFAEDWFDDLSEGVVLVEDGRVVALNHAAAELLGVAPSWAIGLPVIAVLRDHRLERAWEEGSSTELRVRGRRIQAVPIRGGLALRNVEEVRLAQDHARELLAVLSHELRTPLTTVRSTLDALDYDIPEETRGELLSRAIEEADRLARLLNDLTVDVAPPRERSVPLIELAERALVVLGPLLRERSVRVRMDLPPVTVWVDADKLMQVLLNLLENAAVHGPADSLVVLAGDEDEGWVRLVVRDRGQPLSPEEVENLFAPRVRGASAAGEGSGLGLYVVRSIAERWGGKAWGRPWREVDGPGVTEGSDATEGNEFGVLVPTRRGAPPAPSH